MSEANQDNLEDACPTQRSFELEERLLDVNEEAPQQGRQANGAGAPAAAGSAPVASNIVTKCLKTAVGKAVAQLLVLGALLLGGYLIGINAMGKEMDTIKQSIETARNSATTALLAATAAQTSLAELTKDLAGVKSEYAKMQSQYTELQKGFSAIQKVVQSANSSLIEIQQTCDEVEEMSTKINATSAAFQRDAEAAVEEIKKVNKTVMEDLDSGTVGAIHKEIDQLRDGSAVGFFTKSLIGAPCTKGNATDKTCAVCRNGGCPCEAAGFKNQCVKCGDEGFRCGAPPGGGGASSKFKDKADLQVAVDAWVADEQSALLKYGDIADWDVSEVPDFSYLFSGRGGFNADISRWITSKVTNMNQMFYNAKSFNSNISKWITSKVTNMYAMFAGAKDFNQPGVCKWDHGKASSTSMFDGSGMASGCGWNSRR